jgi:DNA modification methylase
MTPHYTDPWLTVFHGDARAVMAQMEPESVHCVVTSPPYWGLRDYGQPGQLGLEPTPEEYVADMVEVFREVRRVLRSDGTVWLNLGDSYANDLKWGGRSGGKHVMEGQTGEEGYRVRRDTGLKPKDLVGIPWRVAFALQADGWYLRSDIIWSKPNPMPESVTDRPTKRHEYLFLLSKSARYYYDADAVRETPKWQDADELEVNAQARQKARLIRDGKIADQQSVGGYHFAGDRDGYGRGSLGLGEQTLSMNPAGRNLRSVWTIATQPYPGAHFATFPPKLVEPCIKAGCPENGVVLDPFAGSGTTGMVAQSLSRRAVLIDLSMDYLGQLMERNRDMPLGLSG